MMHWCQFCDYQSEKLAPYLEHRKLHLNLSLNFHCGFNKCQKVFRVEGSLRSHLLRTHKVVPKGAKTEDVSTLHIVNTKTVCPKPLCMEEFESNQAIIKHLKWHIRKQEKIKCPFPNCNKEYKVLHSFNGHLSKKHKNCAETSTSLALNTCVSSCDNSIIGDSCVSEQLQLIDECSSLDHDQVITDGVVQRTNQTDLFFLNIAQLFLKLECQLLVPVSTLQTIALGILNAQEQSQKMVASNLETRLHKENNFSSELIDIVSEVLSNDPFRESVAKLDTDYKRKFFYKTHCAFVEPVEVVLSTDHERKVFFHYVPIQETLKQLFTDKSLSNELLRNSEIRDRDVLTDFTDGTVFKNSVFFFKRIQMLSN